MTSRLYNPEYYRGAFLEIQKYMEVREEGMEVQEETVCFHLTQKQKNNHEFCVAKCRYFNPIVAYFILCLIFICLF